MAQRRMFSLKIIDNDNFAELSFSSQALYFHLALRGDDDGFIGNTKIIRRIVGASDDDLKNLVEKGVIIEFESGVTLIKHWLVHNTLQNDRYKPTIFINERDEVWFDEENKIYIRKKESKTKTETKRKQNGNNLESQNNETLISLKQYSLDLQKSSKSKKKSGKSKPKKDDNSSFDINSLNSKVNQF